MPLLRDEGTLKKFEVALMLRRYGLLTNGMRLSHAELWFSLRRRSRYALVA